MNKGVTTIEILVVITITVVTTAVALYSYPNFRQRVQAERAARELVIKIRMAQQRTLSPKQVRKPDGTLAIPRGFGIYLDTSLTGNTSNTSYIFFADMDGNNFFNIAGGDVVIETVLLSAGVKVAELKISSGLTIGAANIVYTVPFSQTKIYDSGGTAISGDSLQVKLLQGTDIARFVTVRTTGLVILGTAPQITVVGDITPPGGGDCPGISNIHLTDRWAWNDILGWIDFCGGTNGNVLVAPDKITGYATSSSIIAPAAGEGGAVAFDSFGAMVLDCSTPPMPAGNYCGTSNHGVKNDGSGVLSGWAWLGGGPGSPEASYGWVSFNCSNRNTCSSVPYQVTIDPTTGDFHGFAWNDIVGWISFNSQETGSTFAYKVNTIWRPSFSQKIVNLKANGADGLTIPYNTSAILTWTSQALTVTCTAASTPLNQCWNSPVSTSTQNFIPGTKCGELTQTTTFNISCDSGAVSDFVTVNVLPQPFVNIKADGLEGGPPSGTRTDPVVIFLNTSATLTWLSSTGTVSCLAAGNWSGSKVLNNNTTGQLTGPQPAATTTTYYLDCASSDGTTIRDWVKVRWQ
ncbi:MAG: hypothetical protein A3G49_03675 [Candidatus Sungbacteria bacterium RIFCSPLOWO2_12_FULL_41_11]|uniref:Uncharacterized protein n=1 Tax=Candidatus Sungbacteria bacterium RIFCSPLOWO2_12_FULL_41_11 TaxID=1802286 RepID=A0A1G2LS38_9BACT|nr:MAG: hypothetical protein A3D41_01195 [Candidatus Sungbacteria bacterium RIFCSPHIGHO2_02_FULL_41_12b]OHA13679.1 MAG: hypothetical protein A3G49_03675 [Candidatus Sungbacteria bacterium RIFCSPLOWO2_12_FULL_41_11]